jgi:hypothetical protein
MVSFKYVNKPWTRVQFHKIKQMTIFAVWTANTNSCSTALLSVQTVYSHNHTLMELLIIQNPYSHVPVSADAVAMV